MRRTVVLLLFAAAAAAALWWSLYPSPERDLHAMRASPDQSEPAPVAAPQARPAPEPREIAANSADAEEPFGSAELAPEDEALDAEADAEAQAEVRGREVERKRLEKRVAEVASSLGLIAPAVLDSMVRQRVPDGSLPPAELEESREDVRQRLLSDAAIADRLARDQLGEGAPESEIRRRRDLGMTILSAQDEATRMRLLERTAEAADAG